MLDTIQNAISEAGKNSFPTLPKLSDDDVITIWANVSTFIDRQMAQQKGVHIPTLGTFTFSRQKLDVGGNKFILIQRPIFKISEKFAQIHRLKHTKLHALGDIPVVPLNFAALAIESLFDRDTVEGCVKETLYILSRTIFAKRNVEFTFSGIGVLIIKEDKVKMKFFKDFISSMDGSGNLLKALSNRPGTCDSVMSTVENPLLRPCTSNTVPNSRTPFKEGDKAVLETIMEEGQESTARKEQQQCRDSQDVPTEEQTEKEENLKKEEERRDIHSSRQLLTRQCITPAKVTGFTMMEELEKAVKIKTPPERLRSPNLISPMKTDSEGNGSQVNVRRIPSATPPSSACSDHCKAGQELCYLCLQRAQRNIPVYFSEERRRKEQEEARALQQFQIMRDEEALHKYKLDLLATREHNQKVAAFNLGVAEAVKTRKYAKPMEFHNSYIFQKRPLTPPRFPKQQQYAECLSVQVENKKERETRRKEEEEFLGRLDQVQLAEDLAAQREWYLKEKAQQKLAYQKALDAQVRVKPLSLPTFDADCTEPIFCRNDMDSEKLAEQRRRALDVSKHQLQVLAEQKKTSILNQLLEQKKELEMLDRSKKDLIRERTTKHDKMHKLQTVLQDDWNKSAEKKRQRDYEEKQYTNAGSLLLLDQYDRYKRCFQCKRRLSNCGETSVWSESRYIPGTRLII
ncbi:coiled-coil domain-containing protein 81 [Latimeria chalumnae]|uniref:Coiled-coil domain containing 81 n=1 Tax=Latimeria chalumnae TaxID=7897 RepID=H3AX84_LATCH|nr:PREDICTED: coiled-coil domain-containing protein 81 isoform X1 [Latimeria chalumnae]|eukprot:XP_005995209.1 PREDICTED: coiled-coil domain-containing protein 81 isoform X1 [Latimeria chalumnae]